MVGAQIYKEISTKRFLRKRIIEMVGAQIYKEISTEENY